MVSLWCGSSPHIDLVQLSRLTPALGVSEAVGISKELMPCGFCLFLCVIPFWKGILGGVGSKMYREWLVVKWAICMANYLCMSPTSTTVSKEAFLKASLEFGEVTGVPWPLLCPHLPFAAAYWQSVRNHTTLPFCPIPFP